MAGRPEPRATAETVLELETRLAKGHWERAETRDVIKTYNLTTYDDLHKALPSFDLDAYVRELGGNDQTIAESVVRQPSYLTHLESVPKNELTTDQRVWGGSSTPIVVLVTCDINSPMVAGHHLNNFVVWTKPT